MIFVDQTLSDTVARFNRWNLKRIVIVDPQLGATPIVGRYPIYSPELFARDVCAYLGVPLEVTPEYILIGAQQRVFATHSKDLENIWARH